jgi:GntR family transcriptional regulator
VAERPLHERITDDLREQISRGSLKPGDHLPSESELETEYRASRGTIRKALGQLAQEGLITNGQGRPRLVRRSDPLTFYASRSESRARRDERKPVGVDAWVADVTEHGHEPAQMIAVAIEVPPQDIARLLRLPPGRTAVVRRRIRTVDGTPHNINATWYPHEIADGTPIVHPADVRQGTIALMADMGYVQVRYDDTVTARMPDPDESRQLQIGTGVPLIVHVRTGWTETEPVKVTETLWPADRTVLAFELPA